MKVNHIRGPVGSGKTMALDAIYRKLGARRCLFATGESTTAGILAALDGMPKVETILIDEFDPKRINLKKLAKHERAPRVVVFVAHVAGGAA